VRLSGPEARQIALPLFRLKHPLEAGRAIFGELIDQQSGERIDEVVATFFERPRSYTTEDVVEISAHGSPVVLHYVVEQALARGARLAEPGEFTMRGFLHGRIDLTQLEGALSHRIQPVKKQLVELIALLEAGIDFAEDDVAVLSDDQILEAVGKIRAPLEALARSFAYGRVVHEGLTLAIIGRPNVGKSSLFNRLVERERAIVTAAPGTTRDLVTETVSLAGLPIHLVDTAGIRSSADEAEAIGIRKSYEALAEADLVLVVTDDTSAQHLDEDERLLRASSGRKRILVRNKSDLTCHSVRNSLAGDDSADVHTSAVTGEGIDALRARVVAEVGGGSAVQQENGFLTNLRQQRHIEESLSALSGAEQAVRQRTPHEMLLMDLYNSLRPLDAMTGDTTTDDILNLIFSTFCIGK